MTVTSDSLSRSFPVDPLLEPRLPHKQLILTPRWCDCERFSHKKHCRHSYRCCLDPPRKKLVPCSSAELLSSAIKKSEVTKYQTAMRGLVTKQIRGNHSIEKMFDLCVPDSRRQLDRFTEYEFELLPGYHGLTILAKDDRLMRATEWSCTYARTYFDELSAEDEKHYQKVREDNVEVPHERSVGRWGWERPPMRYWRHGGAESGGPAKMN